MIVDNQSHLIFSRLRPAVPRHYLFGIAGLFWLFAGVVLCGRAIMWLDVFPFEIEIGLEILSVALAIVGYLMLFVPVVQKNIDRIERLPAHACVFAFTAWQGYLMIGLMMTIGIVLRTTLFPKHWLAMAFTVMGVILLIGSVKLFRQFFASLAQ